METLLHMSIFIVGIGFIIKWLAKDNNYGIKLNKNNCFKFLLVWIIVGGIAKLDYSEATGCIGGLGSFLELKTILFSSISFFLILWAFKTKHLTTKKMLLVVELVYWIGKLFFLKGGYIIGFGGIPDSTIVCYDLIAILVRLFILSQILQVNQLKFINTGIISFLVIGIKILFFPAEIGLFFYF